MPNRDGTGPLGEGPRTGRGMGNCTGSKEAGQGRGIGRRLWQRGSLRRKGLNMNKDSE